MLRRLGILALALVVGVVALLAGAFAIAQTGPAKEQISDLVAGQLSGPQSQAEVEGLSGLIPFDIRLGRITLRDDQGVWLELNDARAKLAPAALLKGQVHVEEAGARRLLVDHLPPSAPAQPTPAEPFSLPKLPQLPDSLPVVKLDRLHVDRIELGAALLGQPAVFSLEGKAGMDDAGKAADATLNLHRIDADTARLSLDARIDLAARTFGIDLQGNETGGLLASATDRPEAGALQLRLQGSGPLDDWRGQLLADAQNLGRLQTTLDLAYASEHRIRIDGGLTTAPGVLPAGLEGLLGQDVKLLVAGGETAPGRFALTDLSLAAAGLSLAGQGTADVNADQLQGHAELNVPDLAKLSELAATPLAGAAQLTLDATGRVAQPELKLGLGGSDLRAATAALDRLATSFAITLLRDPANAIAGARVVGGGDTAGLAIDGRAVGDGVIRLATDVEIPPEGQIRINRLSLDNNLAALALQGAVDRTSLAGEVALTGRVPDLAPIATLAALPADMPLKGRLDLDGKAVLGDQADRIDAELSLKAADLAGLPAAVQPLIGAAPSLEAKARIEQKATVAIETMRLSAAAFTLSGDPRLGLEQRLGGAITLGVPSLAPLAALAGQPTAGKVVMKADLGGTLAAPAITLDGTGEALKVGDQALDRLRLQGKASGPVDDLGGDARLTATRGGENLELATAYALHGRDLALRNLKLTGPATELGGDLALNLDSTLVSGKLQGGVGDLAALSAWHQQNLKGALTLNADLGTAGGRQDARLEAQANGIAGDFGVLRAANLSAAIRDARGAKPSVDATASVDGFSQPTLALDAATLQAKGPLEGIDLVLSARGNQASQPFDLKGQAQVAALGAAKSVRLQSLGGKLAGQQLQLMTPARLQLKDGVLDLDQLDLKLGPAQVEGSLRYGRGRAEGQVRLASLPLPLLAAFGAPPLQGTASGRLALTGTTARPDATLDLTINGLQPGPQPDPQVPTAKLQLTAGLGGTGFDGTLTASGLGAEPLVAKLSLPAARLGLEPPAFALPQDGALSGSIKGGIDLTQVAALMALDGQQLRGVLKADLGLAGTPALPALNGGVTLADGRIDDVATGISLRGVRLDLAAQGRAIELRELSAQDRYGGRLAARGTAAVDAAWSPSFDLALNLVRTRLLNNDLGIAVVSGDASVKGDGSAAQVGGRFTVERAEIAIPDTSTVNIPVLNVTERGQEPGPEPAAGPPYRTSLDVTVDAPARLYVRGRGLESEWGGRIAVAGDATAPEVKGEIRFRRGFLNLLNRRFDIREGVVSFNGRQPPIPYVRLVAAAQAEDVAAVVKLDGPAFDPKLTFTSEPELPQDEVLARVLFGRSVAKITPVQGLRLASALRELQGGGSVDGLLNSVRRAVGLDTIDIDTGDGTNQASARIGKYVSDKVFLEVQRGVTEGSGKARVQVDLTPNVVVGTEVTEQGQTGVDAQWRYDY